MSQFNPNTDKIAVAIKDFTLKKKGEGILNKYSEPYILSMAIDQSGAANPAIDFNVLPYPKVRKGQTVRFDGQGHLIYGPNNPGEFLAYTIIFMESDQDVRDLGANVERLVKSSAVKKGVKATLVANPTYAVAAEVITLVANEVVGLLKANKDDVLHRRSGTLLRDVSPAFNINETFPGGNNFIESNVKIIPLKPTVSINVAGTRIELE